MRAKLLAPSLLLTLTLATAFVGCKGNSIEGKWNATAGEGLPPGSTVTYDFKGGQLTMNADLTLAQLGQMKATISGTYTVQGEKLTINPGDVKIDDSKLNPMAKAALQSPQAKAQLTKGLAENQEYTVKFDSSDQMLLTGKQGPMTLTRVK